MKDWKTKDPEMWKNWYELGLDEGLDDVEAREYADKKVQQFYDDVHKPNDTFYGCIKR